MRNPFVLLRFVLFCESSYCLHQCLLPDECMWPQSFYSTSTSSRLGSRHGILQRPGEPLSMVRRFSLLLWETPLTFAHHREWRPGLRTVQHYPHHNIPALVRIFPSHAYVNSSRSYLQGPCRAGATILLVSEDRLGMHMDGGILHPGTRYAPLRVGRYQGIHHLHLQPLP